MYFLLSHSEQTCYWLSSSCFFFFAALTDLRLSVKSIRRSDTWAAFNSDGIHQKEIKAEAAISGSLCLPKCDKDTKRCDLWPINTKAQIRYGWRRCGMWCRCIAGVYCPQRAKDPHLFNAELQSCHADRRLLLQLIDRKVRGDGAVQGPDLWSYDWSIFQLLSKSL